MGPFSLLRPEPPPRFGGPSARNAYVELHNLIAAAASISEFGPADRARISRQHGVDLAREFLPQRRALYQRLLDDRLANADLDADDRAILAHVAGTLALSAADLRPAHERAFGTVVSQAVADECLSVEERLLIYKLQHLLGLDPRLADGAYDVIARERLLKTIAETLCDGELSPDDDAEILRVQTALSLEIPPEVEAMLAGARRRWQVRHGEMPAVQLPVGLQPSEIGHYQTRARWAFVDGRRLEEQVGASVLHRGRTAGLVVPDRAVTGRRRAGEIALTSRRLILLADSGLPDEYRLDRIVQTLRFRNGIVVRTQVDRRIYLDPGDETEAFYAALYRAVQGVRAAA